jgi:sugar-specific transcriptional regulator TrmB/DNA-binding CsgD family transcriptional regulator
LLEAIGISATEERFYLALLREQDAPVSAICRDLGISTQRGTAIANALEAKGLVNRVSGQEYRVAATPPETALEPLLLRTHEQLERAGKSIAELTDLFHSASRQPNAHELVQTVTGREAVRRRIEQLQCGAHDEVVVLARPPWLLSECDRARLRVLRRGLRYRAIYTRDALRSPGVAEDVGRYQAEGQETRVADAVPMTLAIADRSFALVVLPGPVEPGAVVIYASPLLDGLALLFEVLWHDAAALDQRTGDDEDEERRPRLAEEDARILGLLLTGQTDESVARQLGLSLRTVQRRVQRLMAEAGVTTRLQLGWYAHKQGWL